MTFHNSTFTCLPRPVSYHMITKPIAPITMDFSKLPAHSCSLPLDLGMTRFFQELSPLTSPHLGHFRSFLKSQLRNMKYPPCPYKQKDEWFSVSGFYILRCICPFTYLSSSLQCNILGNRCHALPPFVSRIRAVGHQWRYVYQLVFWKPVARKHHQKVRSSQ